jgi:hypothetical protein
VFLVNSRFPLFSAAPSDSGREVHHPSEALLLPKLRRYFAEFLNHSSPDRLGILYPPTCVGLGYGFRASSLEAFLGSMGSVTSPGVARHRVSGTWGPDLPRPLPTRLPQDNQRLGSPTLLRPSFAIRLWVGRFAPKDSPLGHQNWIGRGHGSTGISTSCASTTPLGLALAPDLPWED